MKPSTLVSLCVWWALAMLPLRAEDMDLSLKWSRAARLTQAQLKESRFAEAAESGRQALQLAKRLGPLDSRLASTYHLLGSIHREWGHCAESRSNYAHAIAIWTRQAEPNPKYIFNSVTNLLGALCECDHLDAAEKVLRTYDSALVRYQSGPLDEARLLSLRGVLAGGRKDYERAVALFRQSLEIMRATPGVNPVDIAAEDNNLAVILYRENRFAEALAESEQAIEVLEKAQARSPVVVMSLNNAACDLAALKRNDEAERMFERAMAAAAGFYGEDNRVTAKIMLGYAGVLRDNKETPAAQAWQKKGSEAFHRSLARDSGTIDVEELKVIGK